MTQLKLMATHDTICDEARARALRDGGLLGIFLDTDEQVVLTTTISEGTSDVDELFLRHLVGMVSEIGLAAVVFAVVRASGKPSRVDKRLWRELSTRVVGLATELLDVVVVGETSSWSAAASRRSTPSASRRAPHESS